MFKNVKVLSTERKDLGTELAWQVHLEVDNPSYDSKSPRFGPARVGLVHVIPDSAILWRAAELQIDDMNAVLDVLLTENYIQELNPPTPAEHISRCAAMKLSMRLSTRSNRSTMLAKAANPNDPTTLAQAEEDHPLTPVRSFANELPRKDIMECRAMLRQQRKKS